MAILAWVFGILGGLCAVTGIITAVEVVPELTEFTGLAYMFWLVLSSILLLACIAFATGQRSYEE
ncbi:hypothetical protein ACFLT8_00310 [Chloroflexota bacterium]